MESGFKLLACGVVGTGVEILLELCQTFGFVLIWSYLEHRVNQNELTLIAK